MRHGRLESHALPDGESATQRAFRQLRDRIADGRFPAGGRLPAERQLAEEIGISRPIIRAALTELSEKGWISREPGQRPSVARVIPASAKGPRPRTVPVSTTIAVVAPLDPRYPAAYTILSGVQRALAQHESHMRVALYDTRAVESGSEVLTGPERERDALQSLLDDEPVAGVLLWHRGGEEAVPLMKRLAEERGIPIVLVDRCPEWFQGDFVGVDNRAGARVAVNFLIERGHRRILHITMSSDTIESQTLAVRERQQGYREALVENGIIPSPQWIVHTLRELVATMGDPEPPTAVFAVNDGWAYGVLEAAERNGIEVPGDLSVIGFDDLDRYSHRTPTLTTMHLPFESVGERAAELLLERIREGADSKNSAARRSILLGTPLVERFTVRYNETTELNQSAGSTMNSRERMVGERRESIRTDADFPSAALGNRITTGNLES